MIKPILKSDQTRRSALKTKQKAKKAETKKAQKKAADPGEKVGQKMRMDIFIRDGHKCVLCGAKENLEAHHIVPRSRGGKAVEENLATLCRKCNNGLGARTLDVLRAIGHAIKPTQETSK